MNNSKPIRPAAAGVIIAVVVVLIAALSYHFINRPANDPIAEAVAKQRSQAGTHGDAPGPLIGSPPKAGGSDYAPAPTSPSRKP